MSSIEEERPAGLTAKGEKRKFVKHEYVDKAGEVYECINKNDRDLVKLYTDGNVSGPFPLKLLTLLALIENLGMDDIISWQPHGRSFQVRKPKEFEQVVMKRFFNQTKISSFRRQLNLYDFKRITHGPDSGSYYHEMFLRSKPLLAAKMVRTKVKGTKFRATSSPDAEPNFYTLPFLPPTQSRVSNGAKLDGSAIDAMTSEIRGSGSDGNNSTNSSLANISMEKSNATGNLSELSTGMNMNSVPIMGASSVYAPNHLYQINQLLASSGSLSNIACMQPSMQMAHNSASINTSALYPSLQSMQMMHQQQQVDDTMNFPGNGDPKSSTSTSQDIRLNMKSTNSEAGLDDLPSNSSGNAIAASPLLFNNDFGGYDHVQRAMYVNQFQHQAQSNTTAMLGMKYNTVGSVSSGLHMDQQQNVQPEKTKENNNVSTALCGTAGASLNSTGV